MSKQLHEVRKYEFEDGTIIWIAIDYIHNEIGLVRPDISRDKGFYVKADFTFYGRSVDYMNGWINILGAMQYAIKDARDRLLAWQQDEKDARDSVITQLMIESAKQQSLKESKKKEK